ncbi:MAG: EF-hand domain-containing protein [Proteobacteria bacterium]|nr:EF-hand domain-containing protein [Cystobacterineae bacterium]MCL2258238.1 EF-hand domain-containing protein [Cystobacterineae bacterium]MCL2315399.1 EF-hand domain-containing protein [Pseudomonadota bacterium]
MGWNGSLGTLPRGAGTFDCADYREALEQVDKHFDLIDQSKDGKISREELYAASQRENWSQKHASFSMNTPMPSGRLTRQRTARPTTSSAKQTGIRRWRWWWRKWANPQGHLSHYPLGYEEAIAQLAIPENFDLLDTANGKGGQDGRIRMEDIMAGMDRRDFPPELRDACRFFRDHPEMFRFLEVAAASDQDMRRASQLGHDGIVGKEDVETAQRSLGL